MKICVIPGTFDPVTIGHYDIIRRASVIFDKVYVTAFENSAKRNMFSSEDRQKFLRIACAGLKNVVTGSTSELLADYVKNIGASVIVKGVRTIADFEYERDMYLINREIGGVETIFIPCANEFSYISSTFVREMIRYGREFSRYVPIGVAEAIRCDV
ncbi:phosphopantetheine adenylyltransferase [Clostridia bacterium]|nr:phosphopantetheine adenylyltransferase [Clostridia bacterium]